ncbi:hypothetical protein CEXT_332931 [Caerostris extrusa]|uniref:Uncharacterized protein n=1 Tax=Caerostris extrusa TaxID=172846 RepID=A0AAV4PML1_CAEEX|nr:hypothetical protein CEXT_332931 [Caerostris extrusa]
MDCDEDRVWHRKEHLCKLQLFCLSVHAGDIEPHSSSNAVAVSFLAPFHAQPLINSILWLFAILDYMDCARAPEPPNEKHFTYGRRGS